MGGFGPEDFAAQTGVSRETLAHLKAYAGLLKDWNARHNLVSAHSLEDVSWQRYFWDSAQLALSCAHKRPAVCADLGSGAGFPGLVLAELLRGRVSVSLFEATAKKCAFLTAAAERMQLAGHLIRQCPHGRCARLQPFGCRHRPGPCARLCPALLGYGPAIHRPEQAFRSVLKRPKCGV